MKLSDQICDDPFIKWQWNVFFSLYFDPFMKEMAGELFQDYNHLFLSVRSHEH